MNNVTVDPSFIIDLKLSRIVEIVAAMFYGHVSLATSRTERHAKIFFSLAKKIFFALVGFTYVILPLQSFLFCKSHIVSKLSILSTLLFPI
jgi:hypothetical protein